MPAPLCVGLGSGVELLRPPGLGATLGRHTRASRTWGTLPLLSSLQLRGGATQLATSFTCPAALSPLGPLGPHPVSLLGAPLPLLSTGQGWERRWDTYPKDSHHRLLGPLGTRVWG